MNKQKEKGQALRRSSGQAMVEAMVALSVIVVALLSVFTLTTQSLGLNRVAADRYVAVNLANEGIELVKNLIDKNVMGYESKVLWNKDVDEDGIFEIDYNDPGLTPLTLNDENFAKNNARQLYFSKGAGGFYRYEDDPNLSIGVNTDFKRIIKIKIIKPYHIHVISKVFWISRGASYEFSVEDDFYDLQLFKYNNNQ